MQIQKNTSFRFKDFSPLWTRKNTVDEGDLVYPSCHKWHLIDTAWQKRQTFPINNHSIKIMRKRKSCSYVYPFPWKSIIRKIVRMATIYWALLHSRHCAKGLKWIMPFNPHEVLRVLLLTQFPEGNGSLERFLSKTTEVGVVEPRLQPRQSPSDPLLLTTLLKATKISKSPNISPSLSGYLYKVVSKSGRCKWARKRAKNSSDSTNSGGKKTQTQKILHYLMLFPLTENLAINIQLRESHVKYQKTKQTTFTCSIIMLTLDYMNMVSPVKKTVILEKLKTSKETIHGWSHGILFTDLSETCQNSYG